MTVAYQEIPLTRGKVAIVSPEDYEAVSQFKWTLSGDGKYAYRNLYAKGKGYDGAVYLHRFIVQPPPGKEVDHINRDGLDNRRSNLRVVDRSSNEQNKRKFGNNRFRGVSRSAFAPKDRPYMAKICKDGKQHVLGYFAVEEEAALAYDAKAREFHGKHAATNF